MEYYIIIHLNYFIYSFMLLIIFSSLKHQLNHIALEINEAQIQYNQV
jgi:hypothetical protein